MYLVHCLHYKVLDKLEPIDIANTVLTLEPNYNIGNEYIPHNTILMELWHSNKLSEEQISKIFFDGKFLSKILKNEMLEEQVEFLFSIYENRKNREMKNEETLIEYLQKEFEKEPSLYSMSEFAGDYGLDDIVAFEIEELKIDYEYDERWNEYTEEEFKTDLVARVKKSFIQVCSNGMQEMLDRIYCNLPEELYQKMNWAEVGEWSFDTNEINQIVLKYIKYVFHTLEEDYTYYKKYIYDGHLLNKKSDEEDIIHTLFKEE